MISYPHLSFIIMILQLSGPVIVQVQRLRNVGVPSTKQHSDAVSKRLLRLQLTDGHTHCNAIEIDGPISGLRYVFERRALDLIMLISALLLLRALS